MACSASFGPLLAAVDIRTALRPDVVVEPTAGPNFRRGRDTDDLVALADAVVFPRTGRVTDAEAVGLTRTALVDLDVETILARAAESRNAPGTTPTNPELIFYTLFLHQQQLRYDLRPAERRFQK